MHDFYLRHCWVSCINAVWIKTVFTTGENILLFLHLAFTVCHREFNNVGRSGVGHLKQEQLGIFVFVFKKSLLAILRAPDTTQWALSVTSEAEGSTHMYPLLLERWPLCNLMHSLHLDRLIHSTHLHFPSDLPCSLWSHAILNTECCVHTHT